MPWFYVDDAFADSKPVMSLDRSLRNEAIGLWVRCGAWSAKEETDGRVPLDTVKKFDGTPRLIRALHDQAGLFVENSPESWRNSREILFKSWEKWQKTRDENIAKRKADAERQSNHRRAKKGRGYVAPEANTSDDTETSRCDTGPTTTDDGKVDSGSMSRCESQRPDPDPTQTLDIYSPNEDVSLNVGGDERGLSAPVRPSASRLVSVLVPNTIPASIRTGLRIRLSELMNDDGFNPDDAPEVLRRWLARPGTGVGLLPSFAADIARERAAPRSGQRVAASDAAFAAAQALKSTSPTRLELE